MPRLTFPDRGRGRLASGRASRPHLEALEGRLLLYATTGGHWSEPIVVTYSFVPDGTSVGGVPSTLFKTLNADYPTATWELAFQKAASVWEAVTGINLAEVSDNGEAIGAAGDQQDDPNVGDIRIGATPQQSGELAFAFLPPSFNGGTDAGDIFINSSVNWGAGGFDLETVAIHEIGHALGMAHSQISTAVMYAQYNGVKQSLTSDDIAGIQSIYGSVPTNTGTNGTSANATNVTSRLNSQGQAVVTNLALDTASQVDWYKVTAPASTSGTMTVTMQAANFSSLSPKLTVYYDNGGTLQGLASASNSYGGTATVTITGVAPGEVFYFKANAATGGSTAIGAYALLVNFGSAPQSLARPPSTPVPSQPDQSGGTAYMDTSTGTVYASQGGPILSVVSSVTKTVTSLLGAVLNLVSNIVTDVAQTLDDLVPNDDGNGNGKLGVGDLVGWGDLLTATPQALRRHQGTDDAPHSPRHDTNSTPAKHHDRNDVVVNLAQRVVTHAQPHPIAHRTVGRSRHRS